MSYDSAGWKECACVFTFQFRFKITHVYSIIQSMIGAETTHRVRGYCLKSQRSLVFVTLSFVSKHFVALPYSKSRAMVVIGEMNNYFANRLCI